MALFMKPEKLDGLTPKMLVALKPKLEDPILSKSLVMKPREIFLGKAEVEVSNAKKCEYILLVLSLLASYFCKIMLLIEGSHLTSRYLKIDNVDILSAALKKSWDNNNLTLISVLTNSK